MKVGNITVLQQTTTTALTTTKLPPDQGDQMQFSLEKRKKKMNSSNPSYQLMDCIIKRVLNTSILLESFSFISKCLAIMQQRKKQLR